MNRSFLSQLPLPPTGKTGWPWTEETPPLPSTMPKGDPWPRISIVTPSYNQGQFLEETIRSVLLQGYPNLEYIIIDGGSTDNSVEIIKKYEPWLAYWVSEPDRGQSHAINKGWQIATGEIITYLCSDDFLMPNCLKEVAEYFIENPSIDILIGGVASVFVQDSLGDFQFPFLPENSPTDLTLLNPDKWFLPQASAFFSKKILDSVGRWVREDLHYTMDRELFYRTVRSGSVSLQKKNWATYRHHAESKTTAFLLPAYEESRKSFAYCDWGTPAEKERRATVLRHRLAQGYFSYANRLRGAQSFFYFLKSIVYRPEYIFRRSFLKNMIKKSFLRVL